MERKPGSLLDTIESTDQQFDIIYPDWMGTWSQEKKEEVIAMFERGILKKNALFFCTIMLNRGHYKTMSELRDLIDSDYISFPFDSHRDNENFAAKTRGFTNWMYHTALQYGRIVDIVYFGEYQGRRTPELSFGFSVK